MNKRHWIYVGPFQRHNKVGLMHGPDSGNLLIYYNDKIITIDFKVFESKSYKFFIDEELCEIHIVKKKNKYSYQFKFDTKTATDYNILRNKEVKKSNIKGIAVVIGVPLLIVLFIFSYSSIRENYLDKQLKKHPVETWANIKIITRGLNNHYEHFYYFENNKGDVISSKKQFSKTQPKTPHGLPLENGDVFAIKYADNYNFYNTVNYNTPNQQTAGKLMGRVAERHIQQHQGRMHSELECEVMSAYKVKGMDGLADLYFQDLNPEKNKKYNKNSFLRLKRDTPFQKEMEKCWSNLNE